MTEPEAMRCYIHPDRPTRITCRRCDRPICGECMIPAAVGFQCPRCVRQYARQTRQNEGPYGGAISANPTITTIILIGINVAVFVLLFATGGNHSPWLQWLGLTPIGACATADGTGYYPTVLTADGCQAIAGAAWHLGFASGALWQVVTSMFTHVQWLHIGCNMMTLWFLGPPLERVLGRARFLALYFLSGLMGSAFVLWLSGPASLSIGASGAIFGLIAALLIVLRKRGQDLRQVLLWLGLNVIITVLNIGSISWQAHLGGLLGGALVTAALVWLPAKNRSRYQGLALGAYLIVVVAIMAARILIG